GEHEKSWELWKSRPRWKPRRGAAFVGRFTYGALLPVDFLLTSNSSPSRLFSVFLCKCHIARWSINSISFDGMNISFHAWRESRRLLFMYWNGMQEWGRKVRPTLRLCMYGVHRPSWNIFLATP